VSKRYANAKSTAINDLSLTVPAGEVCVLVGPSGCGKTTAMRLVNRMIDLTSGDILIDDKSIRGRSTTELRREIGYVIQHVGLFPHLTISKNISVVPKLLGWDRKRMEARASELLAAIGKARGVNKGQNWLSRRELCCDRGKPFQEARPRRLPLRQAQ